MMSLIRLSQQPRTCAAGAQAVLRLRAPYWVLLNPIKMLSCLPCAACASGYLLALRATVWPLTRGRGW